MENERQTTIANKNYMPIAVSVLIAKLIVSNNGGAARQESSPESATSYKVFRCRSCPNQSKNRRFAYGKPRWGIVPATLLFPTQLLWGLFTENFYRVG